MCLAVHRWRAMALLCMVIPVLGVDIPQRRFSDYADSLEQPEKIQETVSEVEKPVLDLSRCPEHRNYEPIFSFGEYFIGRNTQRSPFAPFTKNETILSLTLIAFTIGVLSGYFLALQRNHSNSRTTHVRPQPDPDSPDSNTSEPTKTALPEPSPADSKAEIELQTKSSPEEAQQSPRMMCITAIDQLACEMRELRPFLSTIARASNGISGDVSLLRRTTSWMAGRKAKGDAWVTATDIMQSGLCVMHIVLAICAFNFGRWQDFGHQCMIPYHYWSPRSAIGTLWCYIEEIVYFGIGCCVWWATTRMICSSGFLKRQRPVATAFLVMTLGSIAGFYALAMDMLGGSITTTFTVWFFYILFLTHELREARNDPLKEEGDGWSRFWIGVVGFPVLAGALPFWDHGLYIALSSVVARRVEYVVVAMYRIWEHICTYMVH